MPDQTPPLGRILVERGFLTEQQLAVGLGENARTGLPLGQVLIGLGFVTTATIAQALATQAGSMVKTEYGFSTGFAAEPEAPVADAPAPALEPVPEVPAATVVLPEPVADAPAPAPAEWAAPPAVTLPAVAEAPKPEPIPTPEPAPVASAPAPVAAAPAPVASAPAPAAPEPAPAAQPVEAQDAKLAELTSDASAAREALEAALGRFHALEHELAAARTAQAELRQENERLLAAAATEHDPTAAHELHVVRMEIASMRNELATVMDGLRALHARLGEHAATAPAEPIPAAAAPVADGVLNA